MALASRSVHASLESTFRAIFISELDAAEDGPLDRLKMVIQSTGHIEDYSWLNDMAVMREWFGERKIADYQAVNYTITNQEWESTIGVRRRDIMNDKLSLYESQVQALARADKLKRRAELTARMTAGDAAASLGYDGVAFYATTHPNAGALADQRNVRTSAALSGANFDQAILDMESLVNHRGEPLGIRPNFLTVGPALRATARDLFGKEFDANGASNVYNKSIEWTVDNFIGAAVTDWWVHDTSHALKPFVEQNRLPQPLFEAMAQGSEYAMLNKIFLYGVYDYFAYGYGFWQTSHMSSA